MEQLNRFTDKVVVITGAGRGIGRGIALRFAREGAHVVASDVIPEIDDVAQEIWELGAEAVAVHCDVTDKSAVEALYAQAVARFGKIDISLQNAGVITIATVEAMTEAEWDRVMMVNTKGVFLCCQAAAKQMIKQGTGGRLINTASGQARDGFIYTPHYAASKMGVVGITQSLAKELAPHKITVNAFCPGIIDTPMWEYNDRVWGALLGNYQPGELMAEWVDRNIPMQRVGTPEDVAGLVTFLASEDAAYITGQTINVDGGLIMS
ncbi:MAG: glucose 1-dehydrogenase [Caldilineaceae bacterium]|nr:glucose 1-dehydrogenase [Caldilineaceae bacterium]